MTTFSENDQNQPNQADSKQPETADVLSQSVIPPAALGHGSSEGLVNEASQESDQKPLSEDLPQPPHFNRFKLLMAAYYRKKLWTLPLTLALLGAIIVVIPASRYALLGVLLKQNFSVLVLDQSSQQPVTKAQVQLGNTVAYTDAKGQAELRVAVGKKSLTVTKKYYKLAAVSVLAPIKHSPAPYTVFITATGRQVPVIVTNKLSGKPVEGAVLAAAGTDAKTDKDGRAIMVLPADKTTVAVKISSPGMNDTTGTIQVTEQAVPGNSFQLVASGKIYFLSKLSGVIDVVKTNLDGSTRQTVLTGTGKEADTDTILLAARDWKYLVLKSLRDGGTNPKLFLIDTTNDKLTTVDEGNADFQAIGWVDHRFVYAVNRTGFQDWQPGATSIKSFNAADGSTKVLDTSDAAGSSNADAIYQNIFADQLLAGQLVYAKTWYRYPGYLDVPGRQNTLQAINVDGTNKRTVSSLDAALSYFGSFIPYAPDSLGIAVSSSSSSRQTYYEYSADGTYSPSSDFTAADQNKPYPTYLSSPSGDRSFWAEARDGKNSLFVGDSKAKNQSQVVSLSDYTPYGWYSNDYLLVSKNSSELYIMPVSGGAAVKISDYHKPNYNFQGYGGGYGGL